MKYGPRKTEKLLAQAKVFRSEAQLSWREIARRLGVDRDWIENHRHKLEGVEQGRILAIPKNDTDTMLAKITAMRAQKMTWKTIGAALGIDWMKLYSMHRYRSART